MIAAGGHRSNIAGLLLKSGADLNARSEEWRTAHSIAQANSSDAVIKILQQAAPQRDIRVRLVLDAMDKLGTGKRSIEEASETR